MGSKMLSQQNWTISSFISMGRIRKMSSSNTSFWIRTVFLNKIVQLPELRHIKSGVYILLYTWGRTLQSAKGCSLHSLLKASLTYLWTHFPHYLWWQSNTLCNHRAHSCHLVQKIFGLFCFTHQVHIRSVSWTIFVFTLSSFFYPM